MEAMLVAAVTATVSFIMIYFSNACQPLDVVQGEDYPLQVRTHARTHAPYPTMFYISLHFFPVFSSFSCSLSVVIL